METNCNDCIKCYNYTDKYINYKSCYTHYNEYCSICKKRGLIFYVLCNKCNNYICCMCNNNIDYCDKCLLRKNYYRFLKINI